MTDAAEDDLYEQTKALLRPGDVDLVGAIVETAFGADEEIAMQQATVEVGQLVAERVGVGDDWYVYSGNDDPEFSTNQHQGLTLSEEAFVWECQQLLRDGTFDLVFYYEADVDQRGLLADVRAAGYEVTGVEPDA